ERLVELVAGRAARLAVAAHQRRLEEELAELGLSLARGGPRVPRGKEGGLRGARLRGGGGCAGGRERDRGGRGPGRGGAGARGGRGRHGDPRIRHFMAHTRHALSKATRSAPYAARTESSRAFSRASEGDLFSRARHSAAYFVRSAPIMKRVMLHDWIRL